MSDHTGPIYNMREGYLECAIWTGLDWNRMDNGNPTQLDENYSTADLSTEAWDQAWMDCSMFYDYNEADLASLWREKVYDTGGDGEAFWQRVGHDFYLTRNRHGAGFWDRGYGAVGDRLTKEAHVYGESDLYVGDDGLLYFT